VIVEGEGLQRSRRKIERGERQAFKADHVGVAFFFLVRRCAVCKGFRGGVGRL